MSERLNAADVERRITEMWAAMADAPRDEHYDAAHRQAAAAERKLRNALAAQQRLDELAPDLLVICKRAARVTDLGPGAIEDLENAAKGLLARLDGAGPKLPSPFPT